MYFEGYGYDPTTSMVGQYNASLNMADLNSAEQPGLIQRMKEE